MLLSTRLHDFRDFLAPKPSPRQIMRYCSSSVRWRTLGKSPATQYLCIGLGGNKGDGVKNVNLDETSCVCERRESKHAFALLQKIYGHHNKRGPTNETVLSSGQLFAGRKSDEFEKQVNTDDTHAYGPDQVVGGNACFETWWTRAGRRRSAFGCAHVRKRPFFILCYSQICSVMAKTNGIAYGATWKRVTMDEACLFSQPCANFLASTGYSLGTKVTGFNCQWQHLKSCLKMTLKCAS